jgi:chromosome segregation ATPase
LRVWNAADAAPVGNLATNPPRLAERLAASQAELASANQKHEPLAQAVTTTQIALDGVGESLEEAKQTQVQMQSKLEVTEKQLAATKQQFESTQAQHAQWRKEMDEKNAAKPLIKESFEKATAAANSLPDDAELKTTVAALDAKVKQIDARVTELGSLVAKADQEKNTTKAQMDQLAKTLAETTTEMQTVTAQVTQLQGEFGTMSERLQTETQAAATAFAEVQKATQATQRWTSEIAFISQLKALEQQLKETEESIAAKQTVVDGAHQRLLEAQKVVDEAAKQKADVEKKALDLKQQMMKLRGAL